MLAQALPILYSLLPLLTHAGALAQGG